MDCMQEAQMSGFAVYSEMQWSRKGGDESGVSSKKKAKILTF